MPFQIIRNDITKVKADAIVNTANPNPVYDSGVDKAIYEAAGAEELLAARKKIGEIRPGHAALTPAFRLPAKYIVHAVGPVWQGGGKNEYEILKSCYAESLRLAKEAGCESIAFPLMATGNYGFPKDKALQIAIDAIGAFCLTNDMDVTLVVFSDDAFVLSGKIFSKIEAFLSSEEAEEIARREILKEEERRRTMRLQRLKERSYGNIAPEYISNLRPADSGDAFSESQDPHAWVHKFDPQKINVKDYAKDSERPFSYLLNELILKSGKKEADIYHAADVSKQVFSNIMTNPKYLPTKNTVLKLCLALRLDIDATKDLLARAGHALSPSDRGDRLVEAYIRNGEFDIYTIKLHYFEFAGKSF